MNLDEQLGEIQRRLHKAENRLIAMIGHDPEVDALVIERIRAGFEEFGMEGWRKTPYELKQDIREEIADALAYIVMLMRAEELIAREALT